jgi:hypothetical protein
MALQSLKDLGRLTFLELFRHMVGLLGRVISPSQGLYLHRTTQHRKTRTNIHALSGIRSHNPSNRPAKTHASDRTATVTGIITDYVTILSSHLCLDLPFTGSNLENGKVGSHQEDAGAAPTTWHQSAACIQQNVCVRENRKSWSSG